MSRKTKEERDKGHGEWAQSDEGKTFREWWKSHRYSGYSVNNVGRQRWGILPYEAWFCWKYRAEFHFENEYRFPWPEDLDRPTTMDVDKWRGEKEMEDAPELGGLIEAIREQWRKDQAQTERLSVKLGTSFNTEQNKKVYDTIKKEYGTERDGWTLGFNEVEKDWRENDPEYREWTKPKLPTEEPQGWTEKAMRAKIDKAYATDPGQSEEETELLRRRRDDD